VEISSATAQLCIKGTQAEFKRDLEKARELYQQAWDMASNDYEKAIAAHYVGHLSEDPHSALAWNETALKHAQQDPLSEPMLGSLFVSLGGSLETLGHKKEAEHYFTLAAEKGIEHFKP
jgi:TPR repeat protein